MCGLFAFARPHHLATASENTGEKRGVHFHWIRLSAMSPLQQQTRRKRSACLELVSSGKCSLNNKYVVVLSNYYVRRIQKEE